MGCGKWDWAKSTEQFYGGAQSWKIVLGAAGAVRSYQDLTGYSLNTPYTFTCWVYADATTDTVGIGIDDGVTETLVTTPGNPVWTQLTVKARLPSSATRLRLILYATDAGNPIAYFDDAAITVSSANGVSKAVADFNGKNYRGFGSILGKLNAGGTAFDYVGDFISPIVALEPFADGLLYIGLKDTTVIEDCEDAWNEFASAGITASLDTGDYKVGSGSAKFVFAAAAAAGARATEVITSTNLSLYTGIKLWIKCSVTQAAGGLQLLLDDTAQCASVLETLDIPALVAGQWTRVYLKLANPATDIAIISIGLKYTTDVGACTIHIDDVEAENLIWRMSGGEGFSQTTEADGFAYFLQTVNSTSPALWKGLLPNELKYATVPFAASAWSTATTVDTPQYDILNLASSKNVLYIRKEDRPFYLDTSGNVQVLIDDTKYLAPDTSLGNIAVWQGRTYYPYGVQSLVEYDSGTITWRDPSDYCINLGDFDGQIQGVAGDDRWLYAVIDNSTLLEILAARLEDIDGTTTWVWHPFQRITLQGCRLLMYQL